jgi:hypothetical protein
MTTGQPSLIIVTASDAQYFYLAKELICSIEACQPSSVAKGFIDLGATPDQREWLIEHGVTVRGPECDIQSFGSPDSLTQIGYIARLFLRQIFPGYPVYIWFDADVWIQHWEAVKSLHDGAVRAGAAVVRQHDDAYHYWLRLRAWKYKHFILGFGAVTGLRLAFQQHINNGVFGMQAGAPHWDRWLHYYKSAFARTRCLIPYDQFSLNAAIYLDQLPIWFLPATCNWICDLGIPMWDAEKGMFCTPYAPHTPIATLHLAGEAKTKMFAVKATDGTSRYGLLRFAAVK